MPQAANGQGFIKLRKMTPEDIPLGMGLKSMAGWNQLESDWEMLLDAGGDNYVASLEGRDVGTVVSIPYQDYFTWISMVLVDPGTKRKGVGRTLLNRSIEMASTKGAIRLDATTEGYELYKQLGFRTEYELVRMLRKSSGTLTGIHTETGRVRQLTEDDLANVFAMDRPIFGADRSRFLLSLYRRNPEYAFCIKEAGSLRAYCLGRSGSQFEQIGPLVAERSSLAFDLLMTMLHRHLESKDMVLDAFADKTEWTTFLERSGFTRQRTLTRMCLGRLDHPGITQKQFAIMGPETG